MDSEMDFEMEDRMEDLLENRVNNQRNNTMGDPNGILESMSVIDKQNLVTTYVMTCYNALYPTAEAFAHYVTGGATSRSRISSNGKLLRTQENDSRAPFDSTKYLKLEVTGPTYWDRALFEDPITLKLILTVTPFGVTVLHTLKSCSTPINDDVEEAQNVIIDDTRERRAQERGEIIPIHNDNADVLVDDPPSDASSSNYDEIHSLPTKMYTVSSETLNRYRREADYKTITADSIITFGVAVDSAPDPEPEDISCEMRIKVSTIVSYESGYCILGSVTQIETTQTQGSTVKQVRDASPAVSLSQPMNREFAELIMDGVANNYTAVVQIIGLALILHFSDF